jgi:hypothetical protein
MTTCFPRIASLCFLVVLAAPARADDTLTWCQPLFDVRVPMSVCEAASNQQLRANAQQMRAEMERRDKVIHACVDRLMRSGYVQSYSGEMVEICGGIGPHPISPPGD